MKRFKNMTTNKIIDTAIYQAETLLDGNSKMMSEIRLKNDFKYGAGSGLEVYLALYTERKPLEVFTYKSWNRFSKAIGFFDGKAIHLNTRKLPYMSIDDITANLCHEAAHAAGFHHGNNYKTHDKCLFSVPYFISENTGKWL